MGLLSDMQRSSTARVREARTRVSEATLHTMAAAATAPPRLVTASRGFDLIAELKLRSPSAGDLSASTADPLQRLEGYARGGAAIVSVLTEPERFDGDLEHLRRAAALLSPFGVPAMRKDFLVDPYQVLEARVHGASGVLLIVRLVERTRLVEMLDCAAEQKLFVLLEAFDGSELDVAREIAEDRHGRNEQVLMGLNCRDLETLAVDFGRFAELRNRL